VVPLALAFLAVVAFFAEAYCFAPFCAAKHFAFAVEFASLAAVGAFFDLLGSF
tara:strand:- start:32 stop:190 length:159 start_codon:yes stop_codon:yes gene_type:complete